jgi:hypothetical protein
MAKSKLCAMPCRPLVIGMGIVWGFATNIALANTIYVTNCEDHGSGSVRDAVGQITNPLTTIDLTHLSCSKISLTTGAIVIPAQGATLVGRGAAEFTIDAGNQSRVIEASTGRVYLQGLTLTNGYAQDKGGVIYSAGVVDLLDAVVSNGHVEGTTFAAGGNISAMTEVDLIRSRVTGGNANSQSYARGGGIDSPYVKISSSSIDHNKATASASQAAAFGGGVFAKTLRVGYSSITSNQAAFAAGASVYAPEQQGAASIYSSTVANNSSSALVGGLYVSGTTQLFNSTVTGNQSQQYIANGVSLAAGVFVDGALNAIGSLIAGNTILAAAHDVTGSSGTTVTGDHNLIRVSNLPLPSDTLTADPRLGAPFYSGGTFIFPLNTDSPALDSGPAHFGGYDQRRYGFARTVGSVQDIGAYERQSSGRITTLASCDQAAFDTALSNVQSGDGVVVTATGCTFAINANSNFLGNFSITGSGSKNLSLTGRLSQSGGGTLTLSGVTIKDGAQAMFGGCIYAFDTAKLHDVVVTNCKASSAGGGIVAARLHADHCVVSGNTLGENGTLGAGIFAKRELSLDYCSVTKNSALASLYASGGGILVNSGQFSINHSTLAANVADKNAGADFGYANGVISNSTIANNTATVDVGAFSSTGVLDLLNSTITNNAVIGAGTIGGISTAALRIQSTIVFGNTLPLEPSDLAQSAPVIGDHNLVGAWGSTLLPADTLNADPKFGVLQDNGGPTLTIALAPGSPAIDTGINASGNMFDQRGAGYPRVDGAAADIGAYEFTTDRIFSNGFE